MRLHPSLLLAAIISLPGARAVRAQPTSSPVDALAQKLRDDPQERAQAGKRLEAFMLNPDASGKSFVSPGTDRAALGAIARDWAVKEDAGRLAVLLVVAAPDSSAEARLRAALSDWTGQSQIKKESERTAASAFLSDAGEKAARLLQDRRVRQEIDSAISANHQTVAAVPGAREAIERARLLRERRGSGNTAVFGPDRQVQNLNGAGSQTSGIVGGQSAVGTTATAGTGTRSLPGKLPPAAQLPLSQGGPDRINVPAPGAGDNKTAAGAGGGVTPQTAVPDDGRVVPGKPVGVWDRVKDAVTSPMSDAYGFTFEGLEARPVSFRKHEPALAYARKAKPGSFTKVIFYGHGAPGYMTVGEWGADAADIASILEGKMRPSATVEIKGCNTSSIGGASVNPGRGLSGLTRRVLYFSFPYLTGDRSESSRETLENEWDSDLARDTSLRLRGTTVCGFRTFGLVGDRVPVVGTLLGRREATDSNAILGSKACYVNGVEVGS